MQSEFEEKTYEQYLTSALVMGPNAFFAPGQVLEHIVGFDVALLSSNSDFFTQFPYLDPCWRILPFPLHPGVVLVKDWWDELQNTLEAFPRFKFNCFIQAKRPERMVRSDATEYIHWNKPYFRYDTFFAQQTALARLATLTSGRAIVTYACPAFWKKADLWQAVESGQIVGQSNFCEVERLTGHSRYSFLSPGNAGIGHSEPKHIESVPFEMALQTLNNLDATESNVTFIVETANLVHDAGQRIGEYSQIYNRMEETIFKGIENKLARSFARLIAFRFACGVQILIGSEIKNG